MSFRTSPIYDSVNKVRDFMFGDIEKAIDSLHAKRGAPNFLIALGLVIQSIGADWSKELQ
jgi:hypothetical protein